MQTAKSPTPVSRSLSFHPDLSLGGISLYQAVLGGLLFWLPGFVWTWALTPRLAWAYRIPLSLVTAFTLQPAVMMLLNLLLRVPVNLTTTALLSAALGLAGLMLLLRRLEPLWDPEAAPPPRPGPEASSPDPAEDEPARTPK